MITKNGFLVVCVLHLLLVNTPSFSQSNPRASPKPSKISYSEKIYLQLSSTSFTTDQTVWFKAVVTFVNQVPTSRSEMLHVELIDFDGHIVDKKLLKLENGIAHSFFELGENLAIGKYMIRAYTLWNSNFKEDLISRHYIDVYAPEDITYKEDAIRDVVITEGANNQLTLSANIYPKLKDPDHSGNLTIFLDLDTKQDSVTLKKNKGGFYSMSYMLPKEVVLAKMKLKPDVSHNKNSKFVNSYSKRIVVDKNHLDLQFFPEGGKLVNGLVSAVGFKSLDYKNEGVAVTGMIVDNTGLKTGIFKSNALGMGIFYLKPDINKTYYAIIDSDRDLNYRYKLPTTQRNGYVLTIKTFDHYFRTSIQSNFSNTDNLNIKVESKGVVYYNLNATPKDGVVNIAVNRNGLPEGIATFTVYNTNGQPICERLVFNYKEDNRTSIQSQNNLQHYSQRDKSILNIQTNIKDTIALPTSASVLILNKTQLEAMHSERHHILSYFLLSSELKGRIQKPKSYFDTNNTSRFKNMEALMLTQGWRNYIYKHSKDPLFFKVQPEKNLNISGTVSELMGLKGNPEKSMTLSLMTFGTDASQINVANVDSTGHFNFEIADNYNDDLEFIIQSTNHKGNKKHATININKPLPAPEVNFNSEQNIQLADSINVFVDENIKRKPLEDSFKHSDGTIALEQINIDGYKLTPERELMFEAHGAPDVVIEDKELHSKVDWTNDLYKILRSNYSDEVRITGFDTAMSANVVGADFTLFLVDGQPVEYQNYQLLYNVPVEEIKSIEIIKKPKNAGHYVLDVFEFPLPQAYREASVISFISIYTFANKGLLGIPGRTAGIYKNTLPSFAYKREFYAPKYENLTASDWNVPDWRSVIFWEPNLKMDEKGEAKVEYYNSDNTGEMLIIVESISANGDLGYYESSYIVEEKLEK